MTQVSTRTETDDRQTFRRDVQGLRALAITLVLLGHAGFAFVPGGFIGVDVFFVISGFLITGLLLAEVDRTGRISLVGFLARRARRLLPAAGVVLAATLLLTYLFLPRGRWSQTGWDVVASGLYVQNWRLAEGPAGYLAATDAPSILQHFWSLGVAEQFYLCWPILLLAVGWLTRRRAGRLRPALLITLGLVAVGSFGWSVHLSAAEPGRAYFVTTTRLWELALGGLLAIATPYLVRLAPWIATSVAWGGLAAILLAALVLNPGQPFPSYSALLPTVGTAALIAGGLTTSQRGPGRLLSWGPLGAVGAVSYSLYLWHWPVLVAAQARFGPLDPPVALGVLLLSAIPAVLTYRYLEQPIRTARTVTINPGYALRLGAVFTTLPVLAGLLFQLTVWPARQAPLPVAQLPAASDRPSPTGSPADQQTAQGAALLAADPRDDRRGAPTDKVASITPDPMLARDDVPDVYQHKCITRVPDFEVLRCVYGDRESEVTVALAGDPNAATWLPALQVLAQERGWRLVTYLKTGCPFAHYRISLNGVPQPRCSAWVDQVTEELTGDDRPDLLVTSGLAYAPMRDGLILTDEEADAEAVAGMRRTWEAMRAAGVPTMVIRDIPRMPMDVAECVAEHRRRLTRCAAPREEIWETGGGPRQQAAAEGQRGVRLVNLNDAICPTERCAPVIGGVLVYRDSNNLTATYARTLAPRLRAHVDEVLN
ncbi:acyltransferase family protein [Solwaraspora sp. WMMD1047]|uniref:acyltransferase family protein n=1 Tax=Solwaraspora sp. WMMD1047 TaxID=3016102 RepID=UPI0024177570|nr:acyltransferase family protein [Solwaraspora sp. WMMD1047]MDG4828537.1 acyltransferase family protein [Solwaraspora sp. WMMD1047]